MNIENTKLIEDSKDALEKCRQLLEKISSTCCAPDRSPNMNDAFIDLDNVSKSIDYPDIDQKRLHSAIEGIGLFGSKIGWLYATCCTETRQPMYQSIFQEVNIAHNNFWKILGVAH